MPEINIKHIYDQPKDGKFLIQKVGSVIIITIPFEDDGAAECALREMTQMIKHGHIIGLHAGKVKEL